MQNSSIPVFVRLGGKHTETQAQSFFPEMDYESADSDRFYPIYGRVNWGQNRRNRLKGKTHQTEENPTTAQPPPFSCAPPSSGSFRRLPPNHHSNTLRFLAGVDTLQPLPFCAQHQTHLTLHLTLLAGSMPSFYQQLSPVPPCRQPFSVTVGNQEIGQLMNLFIWFI